MSIEDEIIDRVRRGMLFPIWPKAKGSTPRRALLVSEGLKAILDAQSGPQEWVQRVAELRADLEVFVAARTIDSKYLFLLYPLRDAVWEIRSVRERPSIRVLGLFAAKDVFIATNQALREDLKGWDSREWKEVKRASRANWRRLFSPYDPVVEADAKKLVSGALDGKYFKTSPGE